jgi:hypothetical protein
MVCAVPTISNERHVASSISACSCALDGPPGSGSPSTGRARPTHRRGARAEAAAAVEAAHSRGADERHRDGDRPHAFVAARARLARDDNLVDHVAFHHKALLAVQDRVIALECNGRRDGGRS